ncbi:MAG: SRPBCC family protein [Blastocatellia bacterium]|nr:SRPBCC family protein [Blastocatellia bacterium]
MSTENQENQTEIPPKKSIAIKLLIAATIISTILLFTFAIRGSWASSTPKIPTSVEQGIVTQLFLTPTGQKEIHCYAVLNYPAKDVWQVVTDYEHFAEIFGGKFWSIKISKVEKKENNIFHMAGEVTSIIGTWPMDVDITHSETPEKYVASWDKPGDVVKINRGSWAITPISADKTLVVYSLESQISPFPQFVTNNVFLSQLKPVIKAVENRLKTTK